MSDTIYSCLEPRGDYPDSKLYPLAKRVEDLNNKTVYFVDNRKNGSDVILKSLMDLMRESYPGANLFYYPKTTGFAQPESREWWEDIEKNADAVVVSVGD
ncbi:MAG: hypothetical protein GX767_00200 [Firmicutes bacterium]|jgi:hypothetical protein|nr:hypothetical protein [Bacillota bacterium]